MTDQTASDRHQIVNPENLAPARGFSHAVVAGPGRQVFLGGQTSLDGAGKIVGDTIVSQFDQAAGNMLRALEASGGTSTDLVSLQIFTTNVPAYKAALKDLAPVYRKHLGTHFPAMAVIGVEELFDAEALLELMGVAVVPDGS